MRTIFRATVGPPLILPIFVTLPTIDGRAIDGRAIDGRAARVLEIALDSGAVGDIELLLSPSSSQRQLAGRITFRDFGPPGRSAISRGGSRSRELPPTW